MAAILDAILNSKWMKECTIFIMGTQLVSGVDPIN